MRNEQHLPNSSMNRTIRRLEGVSTMWSVSVTTIPEADDAVAALCAELFGESASTFANLETQRSVVTIYYRKPRCPTKVVMEKLRNGLRRIRACGLDVGPASVRLKLLRQDDWAKSWKKHFKPLEFGAELLI